MSRDPRMETWLSDVNAVTYGFTPLQRIALDGFQSFNGLNENDVASLVAAGAHIDLAGQDHVGRTPLHCAAQKSHLGVAKALLDAGADVNKEDVHGKTALWYAIAYGRRAMQSVAVVKMFIAAGARLDVGASVYRITLLSYNRPILRLLLQHGAPLVTVTETTCAIAARRGPMENKTWSYHDKVVAAGGYDAYVKKHRILLSSVVDKVVEAKFGRRAPQEVCAHVVTFWTPPGGF